MPQDAGSEIVLSPEGIYDESVGSERHGVDC